jgi:integrase
MRLRAVGFLVAAIGIFLDRIRAVQRGSIIKRRGSWVLFYYDIQTRDGVRKRVRVSKKLTRVSKEYPTAASTRLLADDILNPINKKTLAPESAVKITEYIEGFYFPAAEQELRASTIKSYKDAIYYPHLKKRLGDIRLRDFRPVHAQRLLRDIPDVSHRTLLHIRSFLSGVFTFAKQSGVLDGLNPLTGVTAPKDRQPKFEGAAYSLDEIRQMVDDVQDKNALDVIVLLALTGLRQGEARGLRWSDWNEEDATLRVQRSVWTTKVDLTKNPSSDDSIPVLPVVKRMLESRRARVKPNPSDYIFAGTRKGAPLDFHNLANRVIRPAIEKEAHRSDRNVEWRGFHGFRRGLASNLLALEVNPATIARILRHSSPIVTLAFYAKSRQTETRAAMEKLENAFGASE